MLDRRRSIAEAAARVFADVGYAQASITAIAAESGVTRPTVYSYFESKYEILRAVAEQARDELLRMQENVGDDPVEILRLTTRANLHQWVRHNGVLTVMHHEALSDPSIARLLEDYHARAGKRHQRFIERLHAEGRAEPRLSASEIVEVNIGATMRMAQLVARQPNREAACADALFRSLSLMINILPESQ